jgi:CheY-like chemotaxis protein
LLGRVNDILDIATIESGQVIITNERINLAGLLKEILEIHSPATLEKTLDLRLIPSDSVHDKFIMTDKVKCKRIFANLIGNAIRFTNSGYVEFGYHVLENFIEFYVKDTGIGISPSQHEIIFQPFCQANSQISNDYGGTGLGLAIAKTYVSILGGTMWVESKSGRGATFFFTLPLTSTEKKHLVLSSVKKKTSQPKTCLVVEDNEMNYAYLKAMLTPMGFDVLWAKDGNEGIAMALTNFEIGLVLMDIRMPNTDGYEATRMIKEKRPNLPIIAQSANAILEERNRALQAGCDDYITKPIYKEEFKTILDELFTI